MTAEDLVVRPTRGLGAELNYLMPEGSAEVGPRVRGWFEAAAGWLADEYIREFPAGGLPSAGLRDPQGVPFAAPGSRWCSLLVIARKERGRSTSLRPWAPRNWERFLDLSGDVSVEMSAKFSTLNGWGHAGQPSLTVSAYRDSDRDARQWLTLSVTHAPADQRRALDDDVAERWRQFMTEQAAVATPVYGLLADDRLDAGTRTTLEARSQIFPSDTLPLADSQLRGYSWITVVSAGVLKRLGGGAVMIGSGVFHSVTDLSDGGAVLQATKHLSEYNGDAVRRVFEAFGPVLPEKAPWPDEFDRFKLIYEAPR